MSFQQLNRHEQETLAHCRTLKQFTSMMEDYLARRCPFCELDPEKNRVIQENDLWRMWRNPFPQKNTHHHLVMAPKRHVGPSDPITVDDFTAAGGLFTWAQKTLHIVGGGFLMRFGPPAKNAGSVLHLHANIIVPDDRGEVRLSLAKTPIDVQEGWARAAVFEKLRLGTPFDALFSDEKVLVHDRV